MATKTKAKSESKATAAVNDGKWKGTFLRSAKDFKKTYQETGVVGFDLAISNGKGLPVGGCILMYSAPGSGKSTLCAEIAKRMLAKNEAAGIPYKCLFIDIEGGSDGLADNMGLSQYCEPEHGCRLNYMPVGSLTWNRLEEMFKAILADEPPFDNTRLVIIDSLNSIQSEAQADKKKAINAGDFGSSAKDRYNLYNKYVLDMKRKGITFLFISQQRQKQGASQFEDQKKAATADGDDHIVDCILKLTRSGGGNNKETKKVAVISTATGKASNVTQQFFCNISAPQKNRFCSGLPAVPVLVRTGVGIVNRYTMKNILLTQKLLKEGGSAQKRIYTVDDELVAYVNDANFTNNCDGKTVNQWIGLNIDAIKDFLKSKNKWTLIKEETTLDDYDDGDDVDVDAVETEDTEDTEE